MTPCPLPIRAHDRAKKRANRWDLYESRFSQVDKLKTKRELLDLTASLTDGVIGGRPVGVFVNKSHTSKVRESLFDPEKLVEKYLAARANAGEGTQCVSSSSYFSNRWTMNGTSRK